MENSLHRRTRGTEPALQQGAQPGLGGGTEEDGSQQGGQWKERAVYPQGTAWGFQSGASGALREKDVCSSLLLSGVPGPVEGPFL